MKQGFLLSNFLERAKLDERILPSHLAVFTAIHHLLAKTNNENNVKITRKKVMQLAKISSISTYHRCLNELVMYNYIFYTPSFDHYEGSEVILSENTPF